jgi:hypothetical protein
MDEMSVQLSDGTDLGEASLFGFLNMPSIWGGRRGKRPWRGWDQRLFEKIKVFLKNQKHEPNIVEVTHMCIMHRVHTIGNKYLNLDRHLSRHTTSQAFSEVDSAFKKSFSSGRIDL